MARRGSRYSNDAVISLSVGGVRSRNLRRQQRSVYKYGETRVQAVKNVSKKHTLSYAVISRERLEVHGLFRKVMVVSEVIDGSERVARLITGASEECWSCPSVSAAFEIGGTNDESAAWGRYWPPGYFPLYCQVLCHGFTAVM